MSAPLIAYMAFRGRAPALRVIVLYAGRVVETGTRDALFSAPRNPYTRSLLAALPPVPG